MEASLSTFILAAGIGQLCVLVASALVPLRLNWKRDFEHLSRLHRQLYWTYGGYTVMSIIALGVISIANAEELAAGSRLARCFCAYAAIFWGVRLSLQTVFDVKEHLTAWWLKLGYYGLTVLFTFFTVVYAWGTLHQLR